MKKAIEASLWFWAILFVFLHDVAYWFHWPKTGMVLNGVAILIFAGLAWFYFWGYKRVKPPVQ